MSTRSSFAVLAVVALAACGGKEEAPKVPLSGAGPENNPIVQQMPPGVFAQIDSGNAAYRQKDYQAALAYYQEATKLGPHQSAAWFGVAMAAKALNNTALADSAMQQAQRLDPGADLVHPTGPATTPMDSTGSGTSSQP